MVFNHIVGHIKIYFLVLIDVGRDDTKPHSISTNTGGVGTYVRGGINGYALPLAAGAADYALRINQLWNNQQELTQLKQQSRQLFEQELNWDAWGEAFKKIADRLLRS